ncbi:DUF6843 domain-containing protein [Cytobacillus sp. NCCP-133]|uniref:DUF6843 domain-containing protein n=1 Tax=Cytobacillus sp. NCCP-133 TaxID=766848 RepID=UPI00222FFFF3|nr:hypothetical protein [Cytobacillus sp. NCCP-133]GLB61020.1 hypothetical protein NCCP133_31510 [Cytobacillus sp. NCCP-133]
MLLSKLKTALYSSIVFTFGFWLLLLFTEGEMFSFVLIMIFLYCLFGNVIYGVPVSLLSEFLTNRFIRWRLPAAAFIHTMLGAVTYFFTKGFAFFALLAALLFFLMDELRKWDRVMPAGKIAALNAAAILLAGLLPMALLWILQKAEVEAKTNDLYLIPQGCIGQVMILHEFEYAPEPETEGEYDVFSINKKGYAVTGLPQSEGLIEDLYYYVGEKGNREEIPEHCIKLRGAGSTMGDGYEYSYTRFTVGCREDSDDLQDGPSVEEILNDEGVLDEINQTFD